MHSLRFPVLRAALFLPVTVFAADVATEGFGALSAGTTLSLDGDKAAFQTLTQHNRDGYGGVEEFRWSRESKESLFTFKGRIVLGDDAYRLVARYERPEKYFVEAGASQFRVWYDGSGGYFRPTATSFVIFDEDLSLRRSQIWFEAGAYVGKETLLKFRYDQFVRKGKKGSTVWGDTVLTGTFGQKNIVPTFYDLDEVTHLFSVDAGNDTAEGTKWHVGGRYSETELDNKRNMRRRPDEPTADRVVTSKDQTKTDMFAAHGFYERVINPKLTLSAGGLITDLDSHLGGSRIYGQTYDPVFDPAYLRRQQRDEGFYDLTGNGELKQTILNLNAVYLPTKNWSIRPSIRFENLHQETISEFIETNVGAAPDFPMTAEEVEAQQKKKWDEFAEAIEVRYTGVPNWTYSLEGQWLQGEGNVEEDRVLHTGVATIDRDSDNTRRSQKYSAKANWYARPGLTFALQYYFKGNVNDYDTVRDNTPPGSSDRYPAFITDQDFETNDFNFRVSWRPSPMLNTVTRYDYQRSKIISQEAGLAKIESSHFTSHILSEAITWTPVNRLYLTGSVNFTWDQLATPAMAFVQNGDNNYVNGSLGGGYALGKRDDVYFDYSFFRAKNYIDNSATSLPYGADLKQQGAYVTWVRRQNEHLVYSVKYGFVSNRDVTSGNRNDFDAHVIYGKVQYQF